jgi:hypothetical protein
MALSAPALRAPHAQRSAGSFASSGVHTSEAAAFSCAGSVANHAGSGWSAAAAVGDEGARRRRA